MADIAEMYKCHRCGCDTPNRNDHFADGKLLFTSHICDSCIERINLECGFQFECSTYDELKLICPWCGYEYEAHDAYDFEEGDTKQVACSACGKHFDLNVEIRRRYSTRRSLCDMPDDYTGEED